MSKVAAILRAAKQMKAAAAKSKKKAVDAADKAGLGTKKTATPGRFVNQIRKEGGHTAQPKTGEIPTEGIMMGEYANDALFGSGPFKGQPKNTVMPSDDLSRGDIKEFQGRHAPRFNDPNIYMGGWDDADTTNLAVSKLYGSDEIRQATKAGEKTKQLAGWDLAAGKETPVGSWDDFLKSEAFFNRLDEMEAKGKDYLHDKPAGEWWDIKGSEMEDVYGAENMDKMAGYIASTAPNTAPDINLRNASEYMRRDLRGEATDQPGYRIPETAMSREPGKKLGMEKGRRRNLAKSRMGQIDRLRSDKVRSEAQALSGDPNAMVFDRWWARMAEDPESGVFTGPEEGKIPDANKAYDPYKELEDAVGGYAYSKGRAPRDYTADVWTGAREQAKTGDLYGIETSPGSISGDSKGYADIFTDLVKAKAKHRGMSVAKFKKRLKEGKEELLSTGVVPAGIMANEDEEY